MVKVMLKSFLLLIMYHAFDIYGGVESESHLLLPSAPEGGECSTLQSVLPQAKELRCTLNMRLGGTQSECGCFGEDDTSPPAGSRITIRPLFSP